MTKSNKLMLLVRRAHLYLGILLMPWALLYGISGYLFNHPTHFQDASLRAFGASAVAGTPLGNRLNAERVAEEVVETLQARFDRAGSRIERLDKSPYWVGDYIFASGESETEAVQWLFYRDGSRGTLRTAKKMAPSPQSQGARFDVVPPGQHSDALRQVTQASASGSEIDLTLESPISPNTDPIRIASVSIQEWEGAVKTAAERLEPRYEDIDFKITSAPILAIYLRDAEASWVSRYNLVSGALSSTPESNEDRGPTWRQFLTRLHTTHGFPPERNARWVWAIVVDAMAFVLVFWGGSGLIMWWRIRRTRRLGAVALAVSIASALALGAALYQGMK
jgi:hypothetical protein